MAESLLVLKELKSELVIQFKDDISDVILFGYRAIFPTSL